MPHFKSAEDVIKHLQTKYDPKDKILFACWDNTDFEITKKKWATVGPDADAGMGWSELDEQIAFYGGLG